MGTQEKWVLVCWSPRKTGSGRYKAACFTADLLFQDCSRCQSCESPVFTKTTAKLGAHHKPDKLTPNTKEKET